MVVGDDKLDCTKLSDPANHLDGRVGRIATSAGEKGGKNIHLDSP
jgi:hypothetical protein